MRYSTAEMKIHPGVPFRTCPALADKRRLAREWMRSKGISQVKPAINMKFIHQG